MSNRIVTHIGFAAILVSMALPLASVQAQEFDKQFKDWGVYTINQHGKKVCYMASNAKKKSGNYTRREDPYVLVTHVASKVDEYSTSSGFPFKEKSEVTVEIDSKKFTLFTKGELAWAYDKDQDSAMVEAMKKASSMKVRGTSQKGTYAMDTYSLSGFSGAYTRMKTLCK